MRAVSDDDGRRRGDSDLDMQVSSRSLCIGEMMGAESAEVVVDVEGDLSVEVGKPLIG